MGAHALGAGDGFEETVGAEVGQILLDSGVPTTVLRAAVVIGSGSARCKMLKSSRCPVGTPLRSEHRIVRRSPACPSNAGEQIRRQPARPGCG
ncbi:hypothetical protein [Streptomyces sp. NPDC057257]|uniref:hypothetical protein n=1 Tax=Streptomyces sp. NPDC057257 TaxID=3346071 RepID=UPI003624BD2D